MSRPIDYVPIRLYTTDEKSGRRQMREMLGKNWWRTRGRASWAGFAAELALFRAINGGSASTQAALSTDLSHDLEMYEPSNDAKYTTIEVKTRCVLDGWKHPSKFNYVTIPMHQDREPIKDVDLIMLCWYSASDPRRLWVLGYIRGLAEFKRRALFFRGGEQLPSGGWARGHGAYVVEVGQMRPIPRGMLKGDDE